MNRRARIQQDFGDVLKHEARLKLWLPPLKDLKNESERYLKYFTLPGPMAYDIIRWQMENLVEYDGRGFPRVCFCEMDENNFANAKRILGNTRGIKARFENIIRNPKNPEYKAFWDLFPYDVYNLDFCGTWFEREELLSETFVSIIKLVNYHISKRNSGRFLLFVTIRIDKDRTNPQVVKDLESNLMSNRQNSDFSIKIDELINSNVKRFIEKYFYKFILISIPKLISFKLIPQTRRLSGKVEGIRRAYYPRDSFYIGKFVFSIKKEKTTLKVNPPWYKKCVDESLDLENILKIAQYEVPNSTKDDLDKLKNKIRRIESYEWKP